MKKQIVSVAIYAGVFSLAMINSASAVFLGRLPATPGGTDWQAYYDTELDITWVADGNLNGTDTWVNQVDWATGLSINGVTGWRLPTADRNGDRFIEYAQKDNELSYFSRVGQIPQTNQAGVTSIFPAPFTNVQSSFYWSGTSFRIGTFGTGLDFSVSLTPSDDNLTAVIVDMAFGIGNLHFLDKQVLPGLPAWAVRDGDVNNAVSTPQVRLGNSGGVFSYPTNVNLAFNTYSSSLGNPGIGAGSQNSIASDGTNFYRLDLFGDLYSFPTANDLAANTNFTFLGNPGVGNGTANAIASDGTNFYRLNGVGDLYSFPSANDLAANTNFTLLGNPGVGSGGDNAISSDGEKFYRLDSGGALYTFPSVSDLAANSNFRFLADPGVGTGSDNTIAAIPVGDAGTLAPRLGRYAVYDADRNLTWIADANLAATNTFGTPGINPNGTMTWDTAKAWIANMNAANYLGFDDWRLPETLQPDPTCSFQAGGDSFGTDCEGGELSHLFYEEFGATANEALLSDGSPAALALFTNAQDQSYWSGTESATTPTSGWYFNNSVGFQGATSKSDVLFAMAVRWGDVDVNPDSDGDGDVDGTDFLAIQRTDPSQIPAWEASFVTPPSAASTVPEPSTSMLLLFGAVLFNVRRQKGVKYRIGCSNKRCTRYL